MSRQSVLGLAVVAALGLLAVVLGQRSLAQATDARDAARARLEASILDIERLQQARQAQGATASVQATPDVDLVSRVQDALQHHGIPVTALRGVQPRDDRSVQGGAVRIQRMRVDLTNLAPAAIGRFLGHWRATGAPWVIQELQLVHYRPDRTAGARRGSATTRDADRYDCILTMAAPHVGL